MPLVTGFAKVATTRGNIQPTQVTASYKVIELAGGQKLFQLDTGGSKTRANPGKQSQTFQLDKKGATALWKLLGETFDL